MKVEIDTDAKTLQVTGPDGVRSLPLYSDAAFEQISHLWKVVGWNQRYTYTFTWAGRPIIQMPEDLLRIQEVIWTLKPDVIIETGVAHGGSLVFYAGLLELIGRGRVIGVDIEIRPHNRQAIEAHSLKKRIDLIIEVPALPADALGGKTDGEPSATVRARVEAAQARQHARQQKPNARLGSKEVDACCQPDDAGSKLLQQATAQLDLSARAWHR